ncbi:MAG: PHP domain-containing protein [Rhodothermales bacterium]
MIQTGIQYDLHMHSNASDGVFLPAHLVKIAVSIGLSGIAITDHDTLAGVDEGGMAAAAAGLEFIPGVEISAQMDGHEVHLLAYGFRVGHSGLTDFLEEQRQARRARAVRFIEVLVDAGALPSDVVLPDHDSIARPHLAGLLVEHGSAGTMQDAFTDFLVPGASTYVEKPLPTGPDVIRTVHDADGVVALAHPGHSTPHRVILALLAAGLDGLEASHPSHDDMLETYYRDLAHAHGLLCTGGSDFHRPERGHMGSNGLNKLPPRLRPAARTP